MFLRLKVIFAALFLLALTACSALPDGARKPQLKIQEVTLGQQEKTSGFNLTFDLRHDSPEALEVKEIRADVFVNGKQAASYVEEPENLEIGPRFDFRIIRFIPANLMAPVANQTLGDAMVKVQNVTKVSVIFDDDEDNVSFNPTTIFQGVIGHGR